ncbi:FAD-dependent oxidoreductase [Rubellicoccus peritrichatus]|uniref:FAD-dependent oxidoreductase n=1 Tax=Rubellicoccus peritrichatus TaxID=3080537 RepID=A0AAQ3LDB0_9BACT|nr:FAD-dependent oxidoreductase [Puniceicoccus sp. CR14]WOO43272.1 FAD-dependent oxidoreductase [Puniceicoccus sp. CR14]
MEVNPNSLHELPVVADVDILVVGGTTAGVALALSARNAGKKVYLIASRPYLGEDICAAFRFWPDEAFQSDSKLARDIFFSGKMPPTPLHVKVTLEQQMVKAGIPFLFNCLTAGVLTDQSEKVCGAVIANRSGRQAVRAHLVVDATMEGLVLQQSGHKELRQKKGPQKVEYTTFCNGEGRDATDVEAPQKLPGFQTDEYSLSARRYTTEVDFGNGSPTSIAQAQSQLAERYWVPDEYRRQSAISPCLRPTQALPSYQNLLVWPGLLALSEATRLPNGAEFAFTQPSVAMELGDQLGKQAANDIPISEYSSNAQVYCHGAEEINEGEIRTLHDALRPNTKACSTISFTPNKVPVLGSFDVIVAGGGTGGAPAAIGAARAGARTIVIEVTSGLGGVGTMGQIAKYWFGNRVGFTSEIDRGVASLETEKEYQQADGQWSVSAKCEWYHRTGYQEGCTFWFNTLCVGTWVVDGRVNGILVAGPFGFGLLKAGCVVDSTGCSDIPAAAGAHTRIIGKDHIAVQGTGLAGVKPGRNYNNSDHNFSDDTDVTDATAFFVSAKLKFKNEFDCGELVDSRERRQIVGDITLNPVDILFNRRFPDTICVATSNFDSHGFTIDPVFMLIPPTEGITMWADVPLRTLLPQGLDGVLVTGLGVSAHRDALPVIRMQADVQNQGYIAGYLAAQSALNDTPLRKLDIKAAQRHLVEIGGLPERVLTDTDNFPVSKEVLENAIQEDWNSLAGVSLILHEAELSVPLLRDAYAPVKGDHSERSLRYAQLLSLLGDNDGQDELIAEIEKRNWDKGWDYRGMGQFGMTMSELDSLLVSLGNSSDSSAWSCILDKIQTLPQDAEFSHSRAITMATETLYTRHPNGSVACAIAELLDRPGYTGHAQKDITAAQAALTDDMNENEVRNQALRELHLARALFNCGDFQHRGKAILEDYSRDCRGHFARHASAILSACADYIEA